MHHARRSAPYSRLYPTREPRPASSRLKRPELDVRASRGSQFAPLAKTQILAPGERFRFLGHALAASADTNVADSVLTETIVVVPPTGEATLM
jgi:hypothetical protein